MSFTIAPRLLTLYDGVLVGEVVVAIPNFASLFFTHITGVELPANIPPLRFELLLFTHASTVTSLLTRSGKPVLLIVALSLLKSTAPSFPLQQSGSLLSVNESQSLSSPSLQL